MSGTPSPGCDWLQALLLPSLPHKCTLGDTTRTTTTTSALSFLRDEGLPIDLGLEKQLYSNLWDKAWLFLDLYLFDNPPTPPPPPSLVGIGLEVRLNVRGTVKWWWKGKECFVYPLQSLTLKLNVLIKFFITTALLSLRSTPKQTDPGKKKKELCLFETCS